MYRYRICYNYASLGSRTRQGDLRRALLNLGSSHMLQPQRTKQSIAGFPRAPQKQELRFLPTIRCCDLSLGNRSDRNSLVARHLSSLSALTTSVEICHETTYCLIFHIHAVVEVAHHHHVVFPVTIGEEGEFFCVGCNESSVIACLRWHKVGVRIRIRIQGVLRP